MAPGCFLFYGFNPSKESEINLNIAATIIYILYFDEEPIPIKAILFIINLFIYIFGFL
jgi:hypothetical protein